MEDSKKAEVNKFEKLKGVNVMNKRYLILGAFVLVAVGAGCHLFGQKTQQQIQPMINVGVVKAQKEVVNNPKNYVALVEAINSVDVVAKVSGSLDKINFKEGTFVSKDQPLFIIDKDKYQANYNLSKAKLESAKAILTKTERDYKRQKQLSAKNIASKATYDSAESAYLQAKASVSQAQAQLDLAKLDLGNTEVKAYIDGVIGKTKVTVGNYVTASAEPLAKVVQLNPIRIAFSLTDKEYLEMQAAGEQNLNDFVVNIELASGEIYKQKLTEVFVNNEINLGTATVAVYADIDNEKGLLKPGAYVKMFITSDKPKQDVIIPEVSVIQNNGLSQVMVVNDENVVSIRTVVLGEAFDGKQVIRKGVKEGERVIVSGMQNRMIRPNVTVNVVSGNK